MKTLNFYQRTACPLLLVFLNLVLSVAGVPDLNAQEENTDAPTARKVRPDVSDSASQQLIRNFLTVSGGAKAYRNLENVVARGSLTEAGKTKSFELIETRDGKRLLTLTWRLLGRDYEEVYAFDGLEAWRQKRSPKEMPPRNYSGQEGIHFSNQRWLLQPFVLPSLADYTFKYQGASKVAGRPCHLIVGYGKKDVRSWFYFDKEKFLLLRWGGLGELAGSPEYMDYRATSFKRAGGVLFPRKIDLLAKDAPFGNIQVEKILPNQQVDRGRFNKPKNRTPVLRQRPVPAR